MLQVWCASDSPKKNVSVSFLLPSFFLVASIEYPPEIWFFLALSFLS